MSNIQIHANSDFISLLAMCGPDEFSFATTGEEQMCAGKLRDIPVYVDLSIPYTEEEDGTIKTEVKIVGADQRTLKFDQKPAGQFFMERCQYMAKWVMKEISQ